MLHTWMAGAGGHGCTIRLAQSQPALPGCQGGWAPREVLRQEGKHTPSAWSSGTGHDTPHLTHTHTHTHTNALIHAHSHNNTHSHVHVHTHATHIYMCARSLTHTHTHTHTHTCSRTAMGWPGLPVAQQDTAPPISGEKASGCETWAAIHLSLHVREPVGGPTEAGCSLPSWQ